MTDTILIAMAAEMIAAHERAAQAATAFRDALAELKADPAAAGQLALPLPPLDQRH